MIGERVRIDNELSVNLGAELERLIADDPAMAERELRMLTEVSRRALAGTRRMSASTRRSPCGPS